MLSAESSAPVPVVVVPVGAVVADSLVLVAWAACGRLGAQPLHRADSLRLPLMSNVRHLMQRREYTASSKWFSALAALLVSLGAQVLLESVVPASAAELLSPSSGYTFYGRGESLWVGDAVIRLLAFAIGGVVGVLLARGLSRGLVALLLGVAILAAALAQLPSRNIVPLVLWSLAGPVGIVLGAWGANARRTGA